MSEITEFKGIKFMELDDDGYCIRVIGKCKAKDFKKRINYKGDLCI